jgi:Ran GTPase-activating protein (RanGAP) involved in mRNA processing and transport
MSSVVSGNNVTKPGDNGLSKTIVDGIEVSMAKAKKFQMREAADYDAMSDKSEVESEGEEQPEMRNKNFEFTNNLSMMRVIRVFMFYQFIALVIDNPAISLPPVFALFCKTPLSYTLNFYSKPFISIIYVIQNVGISALQSLFSFVPTDRDSLPNIDSNYRKLLLNDVVSQFSFEIDFVTPQYWHAISKFAHYFMGFGFYILSYFLLLRLWEVTDYTDRKIVRKWLKMYIADGWWYRGGVHIIVSMTKACVLLFIMMYGMYQISQQSSIDLPGPLVFGTVFSTILCAIIVIFLLSVVLIKSAEESFLQYVSQNVNYTSTIILKRVIKAKIECCLCLIVFLYMPVLYTLMKSLIIITDWNDTVVWPHRLEYNYFTPCYFEAFPPYTKYADPNATCTNSHTVSSEEEMRVDGHYQDLVILPCDSILGTTFFTLSFVTIPCFIMIFFWFLKRLIDQAQLEMRKSRWFDAVVSYHQKLQYDRQEYEKDFLWQPRLLLAFHLELNNQRKYVFQAFYLFLYALIALCFYVSAVATTPVYIALKPFEFFGRRALFLGCNIGSDPTDVKKKKSISIDGRIKLTVDTVVRFLNRTSRSIKSNYHSLVKTITRSDIAKWSRIKVYEGKQKFHLWRESRKTKGYQVQKKKRVAYKKQDINLGHGIWRDELRMTSREREVRRIDIKLNKALNVTKHEFVSDHVLTITIFDRVIDSSGIIMLIVPYRWGRMWFTMAIPVELTIYAIFAAIANYYFTWQWRAGYIVVFNFLWMLATYVIQPYAHIGDRWLDWTGRWMIAVVLLGLIIFDAKAGDAQRNIVDSTLGPIARIVKTFNVVGSALQDDPLNTAALLLLDAIMTAFIYFYFINLLSTIGAFRALSRKIHRLRYSMNDYVVDYLVRKVDVRSLGVENMYVNLPLVQQWDDVVKEQRRYALIPKPDIRPPTLITWREKMIEIKWAALFNLTISNLKTSLGLSLLHIVMCAADPEVTRWVIHYYPHLLEAEDFQRDTPVAIALKECAYNLIQYSEMNDGTLDDGTSYADDDFYTYFPEVLELREAQRYEGEYIEDNIETYVLNANERDFFDENFTFTEAPKKGPNSFVMAQANYNPAGSSVFGGSLASSVKEADEQSLEDKAKRKKKKKDEDEGTGKAVLLKRYPEDNFYDDFEGGLASCWILLGIDVPENNIDNEEYGNVSDFEDNEEDLRYGIMTTTKLNDTTKQKVIPDNHKSLIGSQTDFNSEDHRAGFDLVLGKKKAIHMTKRERVENASLIHNDEDGLQDDEVFGAGGGGCNPKSVGDVLWKLCKYADIFLSDQIFLYCNNMGWDISMYKELNKMSSKLQGLLAQQLAVCFNLNPPRGFTTLAEWTAGAAEDIQEEYTDYDANKSSILGNVTAVAEKFNNILFRKKKISGKDDVFNDRIVSYMAEVYASSRDVADLSDCELGMPARIAWRAISRAFRKKTCTFVVPSIFTAPKPIILVKLYLMRNELDCGDAIVLADIMINQQTLMYCDVSQNNIGGRGLVKLCQAMKEHKSISTFKINRNNIGPTAGKAIGQWFKASKTLRVVDLSYNRLGALVRYTSSCVKETIVSAARVIFMGVKFNKSLCSLDLSYNDLGPSLADAVPFAIKKHPTLFSLNLSGNNIGDAKGAPMLWALAGTAGGQNHAAKASNGALTAFVAKHNKSKVSNGATPRSVAGSVRSKASSTKHGMSQSKLCDLGLAANQFTEASGTAMAALIKTNCNLTALDISRNSFGHIGGHAICHALGDALGYYERVIDEGLRLDDIAKKAKDKIDRYEKVKKEKREKFGFRGGYDGMSDYDEGEDSVVDTTFPEKYKKKLKLMALNLSQNGLSATNCETLMRAVEIPSCTLTCLNISNNPIGVASKVTGDPINATVATRLGLKANKTLRRLNVSSLCLTELHVLPILGGLSNNETIMEIAISDMMFDEPCCLQFATGIEVCTSLRRVTARNCHMGPQGGGLVTDIIERCKDRLTFIDLSDNIMGANAMEPIARALRSMECVIEELVLAGNELDGEGGLNIVRTLRVNQSLKKLNLSNNYFPPVVGIALADSVKSYISDGQIVEGTKLTSIIINDNPKLGARSARDLVSAFATEWTEHIEMRNIGLSHKAAVEISDNLRRVTVGWLHVDVRQNRISRVGCNRIFWSLRQNRRVRVLKLGSNELGLKTGTDEDTLGKYGVGMIRAFRENVTLVEIDLSHCGLSSEAGANLFTSLQDNFTIRRLNVRGNCFDEECHNSLEILLKDTTCLAEVNIGDNKFGANFGLSIADAIASNRTMTVLIADRTNIGIAGGSALASFVEAIIVNHKLRYLNLDGNRMGPEWGVQLALALAKNSTINRLSMRDNRLDSRAGSALLKMYRANRSMVDLAVSSEEVGRLVYEDFKVLCNKKCAVSHLDELKVETSFNYDFNESYFNPPSRWK